MGSRWCASPVLWLAVAFAAGQELRAGEISGGAGRSSGGGKLTGRASPCDGVTISLEEKVKAMEMEEFNISLTVNSSSSAASR